MNEEVAEAVRQVQAAQQQTRDLQVSGEFLCVLSCLSCLFLLGLLIGTVDGI